MVNLSNFRMEIKNSISSSVVIMNNMGFFRPRIVVQGGQGIRQTQVISMLDELSANQYLFGFLNHCKNIPEVFSEDDGFDLQLNYQLADQKDATRITPVFNNANNIVQLNLDRLGRAEPIGKVLGQFQKVSACWQPQYCPASF